MSDIYERLSTAVLEGNEERVPKLVQKGLDEGLVPKDILDNGLIVGMNEVGARFKRGDMFVPEVLMSARSMQAGLTVLRPELVSSGAQLIGTIVMGTVKGDLHDIGKNLVGMMCEGAGFEVIDLGFNVEPEKFIQAIKQHQPNIVGMSALLVTPLRRLRKLACATRSRSWSAAHRWTPSLPSVSVLMATVPTRRLVPSSPSALLARHDSTVTHSGHCIRGEGGKSVVTKALDYGKCGEITCRRHRLPGAAIDAGAVATAGPGQTSHLYGLRLAPRAQ
jgi:5-methyltetrahydrofolate--homocysteine methyltransferase